MKNTMESKLATVDEKAKYIAEKVYRKLAKSGNHSSASKLEENVRQMVIAQFGKHCKKLEDKIIELNNELDYLYEKDAGASV